MNMQDNDIVGRAFTEYPTLLFWSREDPKHPIEFEPKPSQKQFDHWLQQYNTGHYFVDPEEHRRIDELLKFEMKPEL